MPVCLVFAAVLTASTPHPTPAQTPYAIVTPEATPSPSPAPSPVPSPAPRPHGRGTWVPDVLVGAGGFFERDRADIAGEAHVQLLRLPFAARNPVVGAYAEGLARGGRPEAGGGLLFDMPWRDPKVRVGPGVGFLDGGGRRDAVASFALRHRLRLSSRILLENALELEIRQNLSRPDDRAVILTLQLDPLDLGCLAVPFIHIPE